MWMTDKTGQCRRRFALVFVLLFALVFSAVSVQAAEAKTELTDVPKTGVTYELKYADGTVVTENAEGEALSYADVEAAFQEVNWRLLGSEYTSDDKGEVTLPASWKSGKIRIVETKVPAGYKQGDKEKIVALSEGETSFVNPKIKAAAPAPQAADGAKTQAAGAVQTADRSEIHKWMLLCACSAAALGTLLLAKRSKKAERLGAITRGAGKILLIAALVIGAVSATQPAYAAEGFVIHKVDDSGAPVKGAVFSVYGQPSVTYKEIPPVPVPESETVDLTITKVWDDENNADKLRPEEIKINLLADGEVSQSLAMSKAADADANDSNRWVKTITALPKKNSQGAEIQYTVKEAEEYAGYASEVDGYTITNRHTPDTAQTVTINVGLAYVSDVETEESAWPIAVRGEQVLTVSRDGMESQTLSFTYVDHAAKEVSLPGPGRYTIAMRALTKDDINEDEIRSHPSFADNNLPIFLDSVSVQVDVDADGNCTVVPNSITYATLPCDIHTNSGEFVYTLDGVEESRGGTVVNLAIEPHFQLGTKMPDKKWADADGNKVTLVTAISGGYETLGSGVWEQ